MSARMWRNASWKNPRPPCGLQQIKALVPRTAITRTIVTLDRSRESRLIERLGVG